MIKHQELPAEQLHFTCDISLLDFETTEGMLPLKVMIGQERAVKAVEFGLFAKNSGYNIFMSGLVGTGKITYAKFAVREIASQQEVPNDWCYVNNFDNPSQPIALSLPPGLGTVFSHDMQEMVEDLKTEIPKVFSSEDYEQAKSSSGKKFQEQRTAILGEFNQYAEKSGIVPQWTTTGFVGLPVLDDKPLTPEEYQKLSKEEREVIEKKLVAVHEKAMEIVRHLQQVERGSTGRIKKLGWKGRLVCCRAFD